MEVEHRIPLFCDCGSVRIISKEKDEKVLICSRCDRKNSPEKSY